MKLESENSEDQRARLLLQKARTSAPTPRVMMKSAKLEWALNDLPRALEIVNEGLKNYITDAKLWMMKGQLLEQMGKREDATAVYSEAQKKCPDNVVLPLLASRLEEKNRNITRARAILETARKRNSKKAEIWLEAVRVELRSGQKEAAEKLMSMAVQEVPDSGLLYADWIFMQPRATRRRKSIDAANKCEGDVHFVVAVALLFWTERRLAKVRDWFQRAVRLDSDFGDTYAYWFKFEMLHGTEEEQRLVMKMCLDAEPHHGEKWCAVSKDLRNYRKKTHELLPLVADSLAVPT